MAEGLCCPYDILATHNLLYSAVLFPCRKDVLCNVSAALDMLTTTFHSQHLTPLDGMVV